MHQRSLIRILIFIQYLRDFHNYLDAWEKSVLKRQGFTAAETKRMLLSQETLSGIRMTG